MAYNTKNIIRDAAGVPVPQYYNPTADAYEVLQGRNGANRVELYGPDGNPITVTSGRLETKVSELDITLSALRDALRGVDSKTISDLVTLLTAIKSTDGIKKITDTVSADVTDRAARALGKITADDNAIAALGALAAAAVTDPATSASVIALLKGLLKQLQGTGSGAAPVQLTDRKIQLVNRQQVVTGILAAGQTENIDLNCPAGYIDRVKQLWFSVAAPSGASSGNHSLTVYVTGGSGTLIYCITVSWPYNKVANLQYGTCIDASSQTPASTELLKMIQALAYSDTIYLRIQYRNNTDVDQTNDRNIRFLVEREAVIS